MYSSTTLLPILSPLYHFFIIHFLKTVVCLSHVLAGINNLTNDATIEQSYQIFGLSIVIFTIIEM